MLPTFVVIGAMKAGTTALHAYLQAQPDVFMSTPKELDFFTDAAWHRGRDWYERHFDDAGDATARGEASPNYSKRHLEPQVVERMHAMLPDARLVYLVRHPVERIGSMYRHLVADGHERRPIAALLDDPDYVLTSSYAYQLDPYLDRFGGDHLMVLDSARLRHDRAGVMTEILEFIGAATPAVVEPLEAEHNRTRDRRIPRRHPVDLTRWRRFRDAAARPGRTQQVHQWLTTRPHPVVDTRIPRAIEAELRRRLTPDVRRLAARFGPAFAWDFD